MAQFEQLAVIGAGQMGQGIAQVAAQAGLKVQLCDRDAATATKGLRQLGEALERSVHKGRLTAEAASAYLAQVTVVEGIAALDNPDLVVEAVSENLSLKQDIFQQLEAQLSPRTVFASNTSSISITKLAAAVRRPERIIGIHFFNPVPTMALVEVVQGLRTETGTVATARSFAETLGKTVVLAKDAPGFVVNRLLLPLINEACFALQEGLASMQDLDQAIKLGLNHPMGPFELADFVGLDTVLAIAEIIQRDTGDSKYRPAPLLRQYVAAGWLGRKSGRGFYNYKKSL